MFMDGVVSAELLLQWMDYFYIIDREGGIVI